MKSLVKLIGHFSASEKGATAIEYGLIAGIAATAILSFIFAGDSVSALYDAAFTAIAEAFATSPTDPT